MKAADEHSLGLSEAGEAGVRLSLDETRDPKYRHSPEVGVTLFGMMMFLWEYELGGVVKLVAEGVREELKPSHRLRDSPAEPATERDFKQDSLLQK